MTAIYMQAMRLGTKAPPGRHRNFRLRLHIPTESGTILHEYGGGEIRVDPATARKGL